MKVGPKFVHLFQPEGQHEEALLPKMIGAYMVLIYIRQAS